MSFFQQEHPHEESDDRNRPSHIGRITARATMAPMPKMIALLLLFAGASLAWTQNDAGKTPPPVIDVHVHAMDGIPGIPPLCPRPPQFLASDPKSKEAPLGWSHQD